MRTAGIICEFNPFHRGHQRLLAGTREFLGEDSAIVCLMSGYFVQRGEPAIFSPRFRAEAAIQGGADLVLELPLTISASAAGYFADGAVSCLARLGFVDVLAFGSEGGNLQTLLAAARTLESPACEQRLREALASGCSYAAARTRAFQALGGEKCLLTGANSALGIDYLRALQRLDSKIEPWTMKRAAGLPSASSLRAMLARGEMPEIPVPEFYRGAEVHTLAQGERAMLAVLRRLPDSAFDHMAFDAEGLSRKVRRACRTENTLDGIIMACKSKRYSYSRLRRTLLWLFLGLGAEELQREIPYLHVLGFNDRGRELLGRARGSAGIPLISGAVPRTAENMAYLELEQRAADLYTLFAPAGPLEPWGQENGKVPVYVQTQS